MNFHETICGRRFFDAQLPHLIKALECIADGLAHTETAPPQGKLIEPICSCIYLRKVLDGRSVAGNRPPADPAEAMERSIPLGFKRRITVICGAD